MRLYSDEDELVIDKFKCDKCQKEIEVDKDVDSECEHCLVVPGMATLNVQVWEKDNNEITAGIDICFKCLEDSILSEYAGVDYADVPDMLMKTKAIDAEMLVEIEEANAKEDKRVADILKATKLEREKRDKKEK